MGMLDLEQQLTFYGQYHSNKTNILIHIVCVPIIMWSAFVWAANTGPLFQYGADSLWAQTTFVPNLAFFAALFYIFYYLLMEPVAGALYAPILLYIAHNATAFAAEHQNHNQIAAAVHIFSWIMQFVGHGVAERRSPALKDNLTQALLLAPLFVFLEVLFFIGYRPALQKRVGDNVQKALAEYRASKAKTN